MFRSMLRGICLLLGSSLLLGACSGDSKNGQAPADPAACTAKCAADQRCVDGECRSSCESNAQCSGGDVCRDGACSPVVCGDELEEGDEECDNGDRNRDDSACTSKCRLAECGDGLVRANREDCDDGADNAEDAACTPECRQATCGDGFVWAGHEECDDGAKNADNAACTNDCKKARCGDGLLWTGHEGCDDGNRNIDDECPDGPGGTCQVDLAPDAATGLAWQQGAYTNDTAPLAAWQPSLAPSVKGQQLQLFSDGTCGKAVGSPVDLPAASSSNLKVPVAGEGTYSFRIITIDVEAREKPSACSPPLVVDTTPPEPATNLGFVEVSPHDSLIVHGTWTLSPSADLGGQAIQLYGGGVCTSVVGTPVDVGSATAQQAPVVTPSTATYSFKVISRDLAGNTAVSGCSPAMATAGGKPYVAKFNGDFPQQVIQTRIDPKNATTLYVSLGNGEIHKSSDGGTTWKVQCTSSNIASYGGNYGHIVVGPDGTAYATGHTQFSRVEALNGAECAQVFDSSAAWASYYHSNRLGIDSTGKLYTWTFVSPGGLVTSTNKGSTYTSINTTQSLYNSLEVDPFDDKHLVAVFRTHSAEPIGIFNSVDSGVKWAQTDATFEQYEGGIHFNPAAQGWIYMAGGHYSKDGGLTWDTNAAFDCLEVDAKGAGYKLASNGSDTQLLRAPDMTNPVWTTLYTFSGVKANLSVSMVSVVGTTVSVVLEGRLFVSKNSGGAFTPVKFAVKDRSLTAASIVAHGSVLYAASGGRLFKSADGSKSWAEVYAPATQLDSDTELHLNPGVVAQLVARVERWNSSYQDRIDVTLDGGASFSSNTDCCYGWSGVLALDAADPSRIFYFGYHPRVSNDGGLSFTETSSSGQLVWDPWPAAFVSPGDRNRAWYGDDSGRLYEYDFVAKKETNITGRLPFATPAGMDLVKVGGVWQLRVISRTGQLAVSNDNAATFTAVAGSGGLPSVDRRIFVSHPDLPNLIATAPLVGTGAVAYSPTLGQSWIQNTLDSCSIRSLALTDGQLFAACDGSPVMAIAP